MSGKTERMPIASVALSSLSVLLQGTAMAAVWILHDLSGKKAGVNHHLRFQKTAWMHCYLTDDLILVYTAVLVILAAVLLRTLYGRRGRGPVTWKMAAILPLVWIGVILFSLYSSSIHSLLVYPYLLLAEGISLILSLMLVGVGCRRGK